MFGILKPFWSAFSHKKEWGHLLERILYTTRYSITQELLQHLPEFGFSYLFLLFFDRHPQLVCEHVKELNYMCHSHKKNMSCQGCSMFELNSDYIWECHVLKLLADGQVVFSKIFNFSTTYWMTYAQTEWNGIEVPVWETVFITCICYLYKLTPTIFFKLVNLVLVMKPLTDHVYFVGIV